MSNRYILKRDHDLAVCLGCMHADARVCNVADIELVAQPSRRSDKVPCESSRLAGATKTARRASHAGGVRLVGAFNRPGHLMKPDANCFLLMPDTKVALQGDRLLLVVDKWMQLFASKQLC